MTAGSPVPEAQRGGARRWRLAGAAGLALLVAGCSQAQALAPVGGNGLAEVRFAAIDVLLAAGEDIAVAPVCTAEPAAITCTGRAGGGEAIAVSSPGSAAQTMTVDVGDRRLYDGPVADVLDAAARPR